MENTFSMDMEILIMENIDKLLNEIVQNSAELERRVPPYYKGMIDRRSGVDADDYWYESDKDRELYNEGYRDATNKNYDYLFRSKV